MLDVNVWTSRLIGRDRELATLGSLLDEAAVDGATLLLTGEPGVGKTALLAAAAEMATTAGFDPEQTFRIGTALWLSPPLIKVAPIRYGILF